MPQSYGIYGTASIHLFAIKLAAGEPWILCTGMHSTNHRSQPFPLHVVAVAFLEISNTAALMKLLLLPIETHMTVCELQATHIPTTAGLLLHNFAIQVSLLRGLWDSGAATAGGVHRGATIGFVKQYPK